MPARAPSPSFRRLRRIGHTLAWRPVHLGEWLLLNLALAVAYWLFARLGAAVSVGPASVSVLWPPNGLALAAVLVWGPRAIPGLMLGALLPQSMVGLTQGLGTWEAMAVSVLVRLGGAAQWWAMALCLGDWRALLRQPGSAFPRRFVLSALLCCLIAPTVGMAVLWAVGRIAAHEVPSGWLSWWVGDAAGMLVVGPLLLAAFHPAMRRHVLRNQTFPMLALGLGLTLSGTALLGHLDRQARQDRGVAQSRDFAQALRGQLALSESDLATLAALHHGTYLSGEEFEAEGRRLRQGREWVSGFAYLRQIAHADREALENELQQNLRAVGPEGSLQTAPQQARYWVVKRLSPVNGQEARLGVDESLDRVRGRAIEAALSSRDSASTPVLDDPLYASTNEWGVLLYRPVFEGAQRRGEATGLVSATVALQPLIQAVLRDGPRHEFPMLLATSDGPRRGLLVEGNTVRQLDAQAVEAWLRARLGYDPPALTLRFGSSDWTLSLRTDPPGFLPEPSVAQWSAAALGVGCTALLTAMLVVRARRDEVLRRWRMDLTRQVAERTADLSALNTELRQNAQQLGEREALLSSLLGAIPDPVWMKDLEGRYLVVNPAFAEDLGLPAEALIGRFAHDLLDPALAQSIEAADREALAQPGPVLQEQTSPRRDGSPRLMMQLRVAVRDPKGQPIGLLRLAWDITEQRQRERDLALARDRAEEANRAKTTFLSNISHEIRTPLNAVLGYAQLLGEDGALPDTARAQVGRIQQAGQRLLGLINDLLDLSKIEAGALQLHPEPVELQAELADIVHLLQARAVQQRVRVHFDSRFEGPVTALLDRGKFGQTVLNLLANALKFSPPESEVRVQAGLDEQQRLHLVVIDEGPGIEPDELARLFQPFQQGAAGARHGGTGLGLALSRRLAEAMDGALWLESAPGQGTQAHLRLTLQRTQAVSAPIAAPFAGTGWRLAPGRRCRVLVAEDDPDSRALLVGWLERIGCTVAAGEDGAQALTLARAQTFDIVLSDMRMPNLDGPGLRQALAQDPRTCEWPMVAITASSLTLEREQFLAMGFAEYLPKPYRFADLLRVLQRLSGAQFVRAAAPPVDAAPEPAPIDAQAVPSEPPPLRGSLEQALALARDGRAPALRQWMAAQAGVPEALRAALSECLNRYDLQSAESLLQAALEALPPR